MHEISLRIFGWHSEQEWHFHNITVIHGPWKNNKNSFGEKHKGMLSLLFLYYKFDRDM